VIDFQQPVTAGTVLVRSGIQSPNYAAGNSGWTVNQDGSAEFNNMTVRGTFVGTDFIQNAAGLFVYNGTPAAGNLVASIAANGGVDGFGNSYPPGIFSANGNTNGSSFLSLFLGTLFLGEYAAGTPDSVNAAQIGEQPSNGLLSIQSGQVSPRTDATAVTLLPSAGGASGTANAGQIYIQSVSHSGEVDVVHYGAMVRRQPAAQAPEVWQAPSVGSGWSTAAAGISSSQPLQYRRDVLDNLVIYGQVEATSATPAATIFTLPAGEYRPKKPSYCAVTQLSSGGAYKGTGGGIINVSGGVAISLTGLTVAVGDIFHLEACVPLGNIA
jgi:hypothetical protein